MSNLYRTIVRCLEKADYVFLDAILSASPINDLSTTNLLSSIAVVALVDTNLQTRDSFYESVLAELESRGVDTVAVRQEIEMGYCQ